MNQQVTSPMEASILGQKYAYATASLIAGISCFVNIIGLEKALLAIILGYLALRKHPLPRLDSHRRWAQTGIALGSILLVTLPTLIMLNWNRIAEFIGTLHRMQIGR